MSGPTDYDPVESTALTSAKDDQDRQRRSFPRARGRDVAPYVVLVLGLLAQATVLFNQARRLWFFRDDFNFMLVRHLSRDPVSALMDAHNEHWSFFPVLSFRVLWAVFGFRHYLPYAAVPIVLHVATAAFLVVLARAAGAGRWPAVLSGLAFAFLAGGAGAENPLWAFQIGFIGSCLGGVVALVCLDRDDARASSTPGGVGPRRTWERSRWFWLGQAFLLVSLMCSGMGVPMVAVATLWAFIRAARRDGVRQGLHAVVRVAALPAVVYLVWFLVWGRTKLAQDTGAGGLGSGIAAAARGLFHVWAAAASVSWAGPVILIMLVVGVGAVRRRDRLFAPGAAGLLGLVFLYLLVGYGRSGHGNTTQILHSRYLYVGLVLCAPAIACVAQAIAARLRAVRWAAVAAWLAVGGLVIGLGNSETASYAAQRRSEDPGLLGHVLAARRIVQSGAPVLNPVIDPYQAIDPHNPAALGSLTLEQMTAEGGWAELPAGRPSARDLFEERAQLGVAVQQTPMAVPAASSLTWGRLNGSLTPVGFRGSCDTQTLSELSWLRVGLGAGGGQVSLRISGLDWRRAVRTAITTSHRSSVLRSWPLTGGDGTYYVASSLHHGRLLVQLPPGTVTVCGVGQTTTGPPEVGSSVGAG